MTYQKRDWDIVDYQIYSLKDTDLSFRGPEPQKLEENKYFVCIGAAQTFGCFCQKPFPILLEKKLNLPVLNLGVGGAGPYFYLKEKSLISYINKARFAIIQIMSGRTESNSLFDSRGSAYLTRRSDGTKVMADPAYEQLLTDVTQLNEISRVSATGLEPNLKGFRPRVRNISY